MVIDQEPRAWDTDLDPREFDIAALSPANLEHVTGHGASFLVAEQKVTLLHGAYALDTIGDIGSISTLGIDTEQFGFCARMLTFELDEVRVLDVEPNVEATAIDATTFSIETTGSGPSMVQVGGRLVVSTENDLVAGRGGRGRGDWSQEEQVERCQEIFGEGADLGLVYRIELDVREAARVEFEYPAVCEDARAGMRIIEGGSAQLEYTLHEEGGEDVTRAHNWSRELDFDVDVLEGEGVDAWYEPMLYGYATSVVSTAPAPGELELVEVELGQRANVEVTASSEVAAFDLGFWHQSRGYARARDGGTFWTWEQPDVPDLHVTMEEMTDDRGRGICGETLALEYSTSTPDVCRVDAYDDAGAFYIERPLDVGVYFSKPGTCTIEVEAPQAAGGSGVSRTYTFTKE